jgi:LysR family glycine cleavage system transcriptional activator
MPSRPPSLRHIAAFEAAARHESFSKAAAELNLTQGAISHAISALEERLNVELFSRSNRQTVLTEAGRVLAGRVRLGLTLLSDAFDTSPWLDRQTLRVSALPVYARRVLAPLLPAFRRELPGVTLRLSSSWNLERIGVDFDVGLRYGPGRWSGLSAVKLGEETLIAVASADYLPRPPSAPADLLKHDLIGHPEFPWAPWFQAAGLPAKEPAISLWITDSDTLVDAAAAGAGIALVRSSLAERDLRRGSLVRLFDVAVPAPYSYWIVWNPATPKAALIDKFRQWLQGHLP